ncbi:MAG: A/G-specific adenine glycosylase [Bacillota bacterium]
MTGIEKAGMQLCSWYESARRDLPWRRTHDPYAIWVSETMLQQTRVETVIPYYETFMEKWPGIAALAAAQEQDVLKAWEGLGYYSRARNLLKGARYIMENHGGSIPCDETALRKVPGVGPYTAGAIISIAFDKPALAVDANVLRVFARLGAIDAPVDRPRTRRNIEERIKKAMRGCSPRMFNQAVMELGALVCTPKTPGCGACSVNGLCAAFAAGCAHSLPQKAPAPEKRIVHLAVAIVREPGGAFMVRRRENSGLLHGLWEFPNWEIFRGNDPERTVWDSLRNLNIHIDGMQAAGKARHVFTHLIWEMQGFVICARKAALPDGCIWGKPDELNALAWPSAMKYWRRTVHTMVHME